MPTPLTDADKVLRNDTGKDIATNIAGIASALTPSDIDDLGDVQLTNPITHGQVITYDNTSQKWVNGIGSVAIQCTQVEYDVWKANNQLKKSTLYVITDGMYLNGTALDLIYSNTTSGLSATNVQDAVDELASEKAEWSQLQDFPPVTPTASDNVLIVQSTGQGLASVGSTLGAKMNSANPTGTGALSLNRKANTTAGPYSTAEGYNCEASSNQSHAEGRETVCSGAYSHSEGYMTTTSGDLGAHSEGNETTAGGRASHSEGTGTNAHRRSQHCFGEYNIIETGSISSRGTYVEIVGNGTSGSNRSNARTLDWSGNEVLAGDLTINGNTSVGNILKYIGHTIFNSSSPAVIPKLAGGYGIYIVFGVFAGVTLKTLQIVIGNNAIGSILDMTTGSEWSSSSYTFSYSSSTGLKIESSVSANSEISYIKSA